MTYEVYRNRDSSKVGLFKGLLESEGIAVMLGNWQGSNITEIPIPDLFPYISVFSEQDYHTAKKVIYDYEHADPSGLEPWVCKSCGEEIEGAFAQCWKCQSPLPT